MTYDKKHTEDDCDRCKKRVGKENLLRVPFLYLDCNDRVHQDMAEVYGPRYKNYRQYYVCKSCYAKPSIGGK